jgi:hypothetical protein
MKARLGLYGMPHFWRQSSGSVDLDHAVFGIQPHFAEVASAT